MLNCRLFDETRLKEVRGSLAEISAGSTVENDCRRGHAGQTPNKSERFVTVLPTTKNCGLRANDQMVKMYCKQ